MDKRAQYYQQVQLLLQLLPYAAKHECFALKGGTAINLFFRNFPRLSVDIDLVFLPMMEREEALNTIRQSLSQLVDLIHSSLTEQERQFLLTFKRCAPEWTLLGLQGVEHLPAVRWKLRNLKKMSAASHANALNELERVLQA